MPGFVSDKRILAILLGGENFRSFLDPDSLLSEGQVSAVQIDLAKGECLWKMEVGFETKDVLVLKGASDEESGAIIRSASIRSKDEQTTIPIKASNDVSCAFGDLSGLPARMKRNLAFLTLKNDDSERSAFNVREYYDLLRNAALWNTEGTIEELSENDFPTVIVKYNRNSDSSAETARISLRHPLPDGFIEIVFNAGILGLGSKQVLLNKRLGEGRGIICECFTTVDNRKVPSLRLAFDLSRDLVAKPAGMDEVPAGRIGQAKEIDKDFTSVKSMRKKNTNEVRRS